MRLLIALLLLVSVPGWAGPRFSYEAMPGKLPRDARPVSYQIEITPNLQTLTFSGTEQIEIELLQPAATVTLNAVGLAFQEVSLDGRRGRVAADPADQTVTLIFGDRLAAGRHTLSIAWTGRIAEQPSGLYYNDYADEGGPQRMLVTQFEPTDARRMFPCWDEPLFKAKFSLAVVLPAGVTAVSNMPPARREPGGGGWVRTVFQPTPPMSSYLLALVAGQLERITGKAGEVEIGVVAPRGKAEQGRLALEAAERLLPFYNEYFGSPFPLPKLDMIAIPGNFAFNAMENWGAITYIDSALLFDPASSSQQTREDVWMVVAHEMAHQWFGDLVTMAWWDDIWLNEGFAAWMQRKATDHFNPGWNIWLRAHAARETAFALDVRPASHPVQRPVEDESEVQGIFDAITYQKGRSFIRMLESWLGEEPFRDGIRRYMRAHALSNAGTADLWAALGAASGKPVAAIAAGLTEQAGVPLVDVRQSCEDGSTLVRLTLDRLVLGEQEKAPAADWQVPVVLGRPGEGEGATLLLDAKGTEVKLAGCGLPVKANWGGVGYFRSRYQPAELKALGEAYGDLAAADRVGLLADQWALVEAGLAPLAGWLDLTRDVPEETELVVWTEVVGTLRRIDDLVGGSPDRAAFRAHAAATLRPALARLGWEAKQGEPANDPLLRAQLIVALGQFDDAATVTEAQTRFQRFLEDRGSLPAALQEAVALVAGQHADLATWEALRRLGQAAAGTEARLRWYWALAQARDPALIARTVAISETDELPNGRVNRFLIEAAGASGDPDLVWNLFLPRRAGVLRRLSEPHRQQLLPGIAAASGSPSIAKALQALPESGASNGAGYQARKAVDDIAIRGKLRATLVPALGQWLKANAGS